MFECALLFLWVVLCFALLNYRNVGILKRLAPLYGGSLAWYSLIIPALAGIHDHQNFYLHVTPKFMEVRGTLKIRLYVKSTLRLRIVRRSIVTSAAVHSGLFHPQVTGDPTLDAKLLVFAGQTAIAGNFLQNPGRRRAVEQLFDYGWSMLVVDEKGLWTEKTNYDRKIDLDPKRVSAILDNLKTLGAGI